MVEFWHSAAVPHLESRRSCQEIACYRPHTHDKFSVGLIDAGTTVFTGAAAAPATLQAGDVILIPAGHVDACNPGNGPWRYQMVQADQDWIAALLPPHASWMLTGISVFRQPEVFNRFSAVNDLLFEDAGPAALEAGFSGGFRACEQHPVEQRFDADTDAELSARLAPVLERLRNDEGNPVLEELAEVAGTSKYQLIRQMKRATGFAPVQWRQNLRVTAARRMIKEGKSLAETAHALGFVDQSHFHRVFRAHVAATPGSYRG